MKNKVYLVVYTGEVFGVYHKTHTVRYNIFSSKRKAKKYINNKVKHLPNKGDNWGQREKEKCKYLIFERIIDNEN